MSEDSNSPFDTPDTVAEMVQSVKRIELRLVGDPKLKSTGLVQDISELQRQQAQTAEILERVVGRLDSMDKILVAREDIITKKTFRRWAVAACAVGPVLGGVVTWIWNSGVIHLTLAAPKHP
jgi:hypothetical protein